jgi:hypothetical protein
MQNIISNQAVIQKWYNKQLKKRHPRAVEDHPMPNDSFRCATTTSGVTPAILEAVKQFHPAIGAPVLITILPILHNNLCHNNCELMLEVLNQKAKHYKWIMGYNITSCECGKMYSLEVHSVLQHTSGEYCDLTRDFAGETQKWFIPVIEAEEGEFAIYQPFIKATLRLFHTDYFFSTSDSHSCSYKGRGVDWCPNKEYMCGDIAKFSDMVSSAKVVRVY